MKKFLERIRVDISRDLQNVDFAFRLHGFILGVTIVFFGLMGILPLFTVLKTKLGLVQEMTDRYKTMENNLVMLEAADKVLKNGRVNDEYLDEYMPEDTHTHKYILDFVAVMGANGFIVDSFNQAFTPLSGSQPEISVTIEGFDYPTKLASVIENLKRVTQIISLDYIAGDVGKPHVINLVLLIYNYY